METIKLTIDNRTAEVAPGTNLVEAAASVGIKIPTLCYLNLHELGCKNDPGVCRICVVEVEGRKNLAPACKTVCTEGMVVRTHTPRVINARQTILELILSDHPNECLTCSKNGYCSLQTMAKDLGIREAKYKGETTKPMMDLSPSVVRNMEKCILCRRCVAACQAQHISVIGANARGALSVVGRGFTSVLCTAFNDPILTTNCVNCGQCVAVCPTSALSENSNIREVMQALADPGKTVVVQTAPAVRVALGQDFGLEGRSVTGKMTTALRRLGFDYVFDTDFAADLTIMEEGTELLQRLNKYLAGDRTVKIPLMTSCCPGWVSFMEKHFPELGENLSTAKSPQQMFGAIAKNYLAPKLGIDRRNFIVVSVMPCVAKKSEAARPEFGKDGDPDVNISITTRELAHMIRFANMNFDELEEKMNAANIEAGKKFLEENKKREGVVTLPSGLQYEVITEGNVGHYAKATDQVQCHYEGTLIDGTLFDSSIKRGQPATFGVNQVIPGWVEALQLMPEGAKWKLYIPSDLAYGAQGAGEMIPPHSTL